MIAASKLVNEKLDDQKDRQAIEQFVKEVISRWAELPVAMQ